MLLRLAPDAIAALGRGLSDGINGHQRHQRQDDDRRHDRLGAAAAGRRPVHNRAGSNMTWGVATALLEQAGTEGLFEVDEAWLPKIASELEPRLIVLGNLFRDQLDRYGELERARRRLGRAGRRSARAQPASSSTPTIPLIADLGRDRELAPARRRDLLRDRGPSPGASRSSSTLTTPSTAGAAARRTRTSAPSSATSATTRAPTAAPTGPRPDIAATADRARRHARLRGRQVHARRRRCELRLPLPGLYNVYNALAALAAALDLGVTAEQAVAGLERVEAAFGRVETVEVAGKPVSILLIKNPAGRQRGAAHPRLEASASGGGIDLWIALNDRIADGRDVSWVWDADFELLAGRVAPRHLRGHPRPGDGGAAEVRGVDPRADRGTAGRSQASLDAAVAAAPRRLFALPTYTALLELRTLLADRGLAKEYWA